MTSFRTLDDLDVAGKTVLVRADLNVPMEGDRITDTTRIDRFAPTAATLAARGAKVLVLSHFGRPKGQVVPAMSLEGLTSALAQAVGRSVRFVPDCVGDAVAAAVGDMADGDVLLTENLRFHAGEEQNDEAFAAALAAPGDLYVNDAFSCAHRAHASTEGITHHLPSAAGLLMAEELAALTAALEKPERPVAALVGGAKVSTKLDVLRNLAAKVDYLIVGGGMANTFLFATGHEVGNSLCEHDMAASAQAVLDAAAAGNCRVVLPEDLVVAAALTENAETAVVAADAIPDDQSALDVGPASVAALKAILSDCRTMVWNGPLGAFEVKPFDDATNALARHAAVLTRQGALRTVAGGGDTVAALANAGVLQDFSYVSSAGGAFLEWLEGRALPGVAALTAAG